MYKLLLLFVIFLFVSFELYKRYDKFTVPESIHLVATSQNSQIRLYWHMPVNFRNDIYNFLLYIKEQGKDVKLLTITPKRNEDFYEKTITGLDPQKTYMFKVVSLTQNGVSLPSNVVSIQPKDKYLVIPRPLPPLEKKITCNPDGTHIIGTSCVNPVYPNTAFDDSSHTDLIKTLEQTPEDKYLNF